MLDGDQPDSVPVSVVLRLMSNEGERLTAMADRMDNILAEAAGTNADPVTLAALQEMDYLRQGVSVLTELSRNLASETNRADHLSVSRQQVGSGVKPANIRDLCLYGEVAACPKAAEQTPCDDDIFNF